MNYLYAATVAICFAFIYFILPKKEKKTADFLLVILNVLICLFLLSDALVNEELSSFNISFQNTIPFFLFPIFCFYSFQFIYHRREIPRFWYLLFIPGIAFIIFSSLDHTILNSYNQSQLKEHFSNPDWPYQVFFKGSQIIFIVTLFRIIYLLNVFEEKLKRGYSEIETVSIVWLKNFAMIYLASLLITFILFSAYNLNLFTVPIQLVFGIVNGILVLSVFYLNFQGIKHYTLSQVYAILPNEEEIELPIKQSRNVSSEKSKLLHNQIIKAFENDELYLQPQLGLKDLAKKIGESTHVVSEVINQEVGKSFYDLVNGYRVQHLKKLLDNPKNQQFTILALGLQSGFNSKASLNRIFKNTTGITPNEYLKSKSQSIG